MASNKLTKALKQRKLEYIRIMRKRMRMFYSTRKG
jgi:hypothetical protein